MKHHNLMIQSGFGLLEIVLVVSIVSVVSIGLILIVGNLVGVGTGTAQAVTATLLIEETAEVARLFRDIHWSNIANLAAEVDYYLVFSGNSWATSTAPVLVDGVFDRHFTVAPVYRNGGDDITDSGGTLDLDTHRISVSVSWWARQATTTRSFDFILTNLFNDEV